MKLVFLAQDSDHREDKLLLSATAYDDEGNLVGPGTTDMEPWEGVLWLSAAPANTIVELQWERP